MRKPVSRAIVETVSVLVAFTLMFASTHSALAVPKGGGSTQCTPKQLNSSLAAQACVTQGANDVVNGKKKTSMVVCHADGSMSCCLLSENGTVLDDTCDDISTRRNPVQGIVAPNAGLSPSGIYTSPPHRGPVTPRPPSSGVKNPGGSAPPPSRHRHPVKITGFKPPPRGHHGHHHPVKITGFRPPSGVKTTGGNSTPVTIGRQEHHSDGHK